ncbi:unnamed protein product [Soboliphyme baturini]|uniref:Uncharacterized protein n=1 Tax=Soboliphyme baturini TaxID=241478 RepID=A0A183IH84_9BILA|nr:unnamed protein product [Soboliphyme baturini]
MRRRTPATVHKSRRFPVNFAHKPVNRVCCRFRQDFSFLVVYGLSAENEPVERLPPLHVPPQSSGNCRSDFSTCHNQATDEQMFVDNRS